MEKVGVLPDDIIEDILLRLRAKPLVLFKSVSKAWYQLISHSRFTTDHLNHGGGKTKIMFQIRTRAANEPVKYKYPAVDYDALGEDVEMPDEAFTDMSMMHNSCHGLVVMERRPRDGTVYVWNPTTGQRRLLPKPKSTLKNNQDFSYGIGYDPIAKVYKVLYNNYDINKHRVQWSLYNQSTNSWKELEDIPYRSVNFGQRYLKNALHIFACPSTSSSSTATLILAFDISNEMFREIPLPNYGDQNSCMIDMEASHSCLCLVSYIRDHGAVNVWVLKEYGNPESWTKMFSINREIFTGDQLFSVHLSDSAKLLLHDDCSSPCLVRYDSVTKNTNTFKPIIRGLSLLETHIYVESLVRFDIDIDESPDEENREIKRRFTKKCCFKVANFSTP